MPPDLDFPPGLGFEPLSEQAKAKNPRRKAKQRLKKYEKYEETVRAAAARDAGPVADDRRAAT